MPVLELRDLSKTFARRGAVAVKAVDRVSLTVEEGECLAIVGESGSGKSTLARMALCLIAPDPGGEIVLNGRSLLSMSAAELRVHRLAMQPVFQDPSAAFNPRRSVRSTLEQALAQRPKEQDRSELTPAELLRQVALRPAEDFLPRLPHELSGGQRQRLAIARALAVGPRLIIADEPLSGADVSIRAQILNLLAELQRDRGLAYLLITHDMLVARAIADRIAVMHRGRIVEEGRADEVMHRPRDPYTVGLLSAVQSIDVGLPEAKDDAGPRAAAMRP